MSRSNQNCNFFERLCRRCINKVTPCSRTISPGFKYEHEDPKENPNRKFANNVVRTTKYTILTFLPLNLWEQLHRYANLYFIFVIILNFLPEVSAFVKEISPIPLVFVLGVTAVKDAFEDYQRYRADKRVNKKKCIVYRMSAGDFVEDQCHNLLAGDIIQLSGDEIIPADILLLHSSDPAGICYIETSNLDGETNLKQRSVAMAMDTRAGRRASKRRREDRSEFNPSCFTYDIEVEQPHPDIHRFEGKILVDDNANHNVAVHAENLMLRGCKLKNTDKIIGMIIYAGQETKASLNNEGARFKRSKLEQQINNSVIWCIVLLLVMCIFGAIANGIWTSGFSDTTAIIFLSLASDSSIFSSPAMQAFINFWTYIIILQSMVPLALYVTIELVKMGQIMYIENDMELYDPVRETMAECKAWNITEDLGQIQYVFCDKTGTLTENQMALKRCSINGRDYAEGKPLLANGNSHADHQGAKSARDMESVPSRHQDGPSTGTAQKMPMDRLNRQLARALASEAPPSQQDRQLIDFFLVMSLCNSVLVSLRKADAAGAAAEAAAAEAAEDAADDAEAADGEPSSSARLGAHSNVVKLVPNFSELEAAAAVATPGDEPEPERESARRQKTKQHRKHKAGKKSKRSKRSRRAAGEFAEEEEEEEKFGSVPDAELMSAYISDSPDEAAMVAASCRCGVVLLQRSPHRCLVRLPGLGEVRVRLLHSLPFDAERKRMSVVIKHPVTKAITLLTKGADSVILNLLEAPDASDPASDEERIRLSTRLHLQSYANHGLRTLCLASRTLGAEEYADWLAELRRVDQSMASNRASAIGRLACLLERDLRLLGVTGVEDRLQEGVQDTLASLRAAGMSVWVLTGDKQETALQVSLEAKLLSPRQTLLRLNAPDSRAECAALVARFLGRIERDFPPEGQIRQRMERPAVRSELALVVDGDTLKHCLAKAGGGAAADDDADAAGAGDKRGGDLQADFLRLAEQCASVVCCRAAPRQKAAVVSLVKAKGMRTLAIGDGANDVNMIQTADVGIGLSGQEGMQAVMAADFALARFRFLKRLLLVHGHWCYDRLARMALLLFYKNALYCLLLFWYQLFNGFSGQVNIGQLYQMFFNLLMTSLPPLIMGIFDKHIRDDVLMANPVLYKDAANSRSYLPWHFWYNISDAVWQSLVIFFIPFFTIVDSDWDMYSFGDVVIGGGVVAAILHNSLEVKGWMILHWASFIGSPLIGWILIAMCVSMICSNCLHPENPYYQIIRNMGDPLFWLAQLAVAALAVLPRFCYRAAANTLSSNLSTQAMRLQNLPRYRANPDMTSCRGGLRVPRDVFSIGSEDVNRSMRMRSTPLLPRSVVGSGQLNSHHSNGYQNHQQQQQQQQNEQQNNHQGKLAAAAPAGGSQHRRSRSDAVETSIV